MGSLKKWLLASAVVAVVLVCASPRSAEAGWRYRAGPAAYGAWYFGGAGSPNLFYATNGLVTVTVPPTVIVTPRYMARRPLYNPYLYYADPRLPYGGYYFRPY